MQLLHSKTAAFKKHEKNFLITIINCSLERLTRKNRLYVITSIIN